MKITLTLLLDDKAARTTDLAIADYLAQTVGQVTAGRADGSLRGQDGQQVGSFVLERKK